MYNSSGARRRAKATKTTNGLYSGMTRLTRGKYSRRMVSIVQKKAAESAEDTSSAVGCGDIGIPKYSGGKNPGRGSDGLTPLPGN